MLNKIFLSFVAFTAIVLFTDSGNAQQKFIAALNSDQVVPANGSNARGTCDATFNPVDHSLVVNCVYSGLAGPLTAAHVHGAVAGDNGALAFDLGRTGGTSGAFSNDLYFPGTNDPKLRKKGFYVELDTADLPDGEIRGQFKEVMPDLDSDGDARADAFVARYNNGPDRGNLGTVTAYSLGSAAQKWASFRFEDPDALGYHQPFLADYDGDGIADIASLYHPLNDSQTYIAYLASRDNTFVSVPWGLVTDKLVIGNFDGDLKMDIAVFRPDDGYWYILQSSDGQARYEKWGMLGDQPCAADYDKDGITDLCVRRVESGQWAWYYLRSTNSMFSRTAWGRDTDYVYANSPVDVDADGADDIMIARNENGKRTFYALRSSDDKWFILQWGLETDDARLGDFDGDGKTDVSAIREIDGSLVWMINRSSDGQMSVFNWGLPGDN